MNKSKLVAYFFKIVAPGNEHDQYNAGDREFFCEGVTRIDFRNQQFDYDVVQVWTTANGYGLVAVKFGNELHINECYLLREEQLS